MRLLIAGIGNIFRGDDAFGCEVAKVLTTRPLPEGVVVRDFGTRGFDLACALLEGYDGSILLDATSRGRAPGTLYLIEPEAFEATTAVDPHGLTPEHVLRLVAALGGQPPWLRVLGCEPECFGDEDEGAMGLSEPVQAAVGEAARMAEWPGRFWVRTWLDRRTGGFTMSRILGFMLALLTESIFLVGMLFAIPSLLRYRRIRAM